MVLVLGYSDLEGLKLRARTLSTLRGLGLLDAQPSRSGISSHYSPGDAFAAWMYDRVGSAISGERKTTNWRSPHLFTLYRRVGAQIYSGRLECPEGVVTVWKATDGARPPEYGLTLGRSWSQRDYVAVCVDIEPFIEWVGSLDPSGPRFNWGLPESVENEIREALIAGESKSSIRRRLDVPYGAVSGLERCAARMVEKAPT